MKITEPEKLYQELKQLDHDIKLLMLSDRFNSRILELRKRFGIPADGFKDNKSEHAKKDTYTKTDLEEIERDLYKIIAEFSVLTASWLQSLRWYLFQNEPSLFMGRPSWEIKIDGDPDDPQDVRYAWIKIDDRTDWPAVKEAYLAAKEHLEQKGKYQPIIYIDDAMLARKLKTADETWAKVAERVTEITSHSYDETSIRKLVTTLNKRIP